jgi:hypothetical protein
VVGQRWGFIDKEGKLVINPQFDFAGAFRDGLANVMIGQRQAYVDRGGKTVWIQQPDDEQETISDMNIIALGTAAFTRYYGQPPNASSIDQLAAYLSPRFVSSFARADKWGTPFRYVSDGREFAIISAGSDRVFSTTGIPPSPATPQVTTAAGADIVYAHGRFVQYPAGRQVEKEGD